MTAIDYCKPIKVSENHKDRSNKLQLRKGADGSGMKDGSVLSNLWVIGEPSIFTDRVADLLGDNDHG